MLNTYKFKLTGIAPLLMHNGQLADPRNPFAKAMKEITVTRKKTDDTHEEISRREWFGGLYTQDGVVGLPADMLTAALIEGAKKIKMGTQTKAGVYEAESFYPLIHDGPKTPEALYEDGRFIDVRGVRVQKSRVMRTRPIFREWSLNCSFLVEDSVKAQKGGLLICPDLLASEHLARFVKRGERIIKNGARELANRVDTRGFDEGQKKLHETRTRVGQGFVLGIQWAKRSLRSGALPEVSPRPRLPGPKNV